MDRRVSNVVRVPEPSHYGPGIALVVGYSSRVQILQMFRHCQIEHDIWIVDVCVGIGDPEARQSHLCIAQKVLPTQCNWPDKLTENYFAICAQNCDTGGLN
jgi:hypothetical protein